MLLPKTENDKIAGWTERLKGNPGGLGLDVDIDKSKVTALHLKNGSKDAPTLVIPVSMLQDLVEVADLLNGAPMSKGGA